VPDYYCIDGQQSDDLLTEDDPDECVDLYLSHLTQDQTPETIVLVGYDIYGEYDAETGYPLRRVSEEEIDTADWIAENWSDWIEPIE